MCSSADGDESTRWDGCVPLQSTLEIVKWATWRRDGYTVSRVEYGDVGG